MAHDYFDGLDDLYCREGARCVTPGVTPRLHPG